MKQIIGIFVVILTILNSEQIQAQINFSDQSGGFGPYLGLIRSNLKQPTPGGKQGVFDMYQGFEVGIKSELYRTQWMRGNLIASYLQQGAHENFDVENTNQPVDVNLKQVKLALNPLLFKAGSDMIHGYVGGGVYGSYIIEQGISDEALRDQYWSGAEELSGKDVGLDLVAGIHVWAFDIEAHAQYGFLELGTRWDGSPVKHKFFGLSIAYLYVNQHVTRKNCRDTKKSNPKNRL